MANWECRFCHCKNDDSKKNCKKCNYYHSPKGEGRYMSNRYDHDADLLQDADMLSLIDQESNEVIWIKDSINVTVQSTDTQASISLQAALQLAIALIISITVADSERGNEITQDLLQHFESEQLNKQKILVRNSKDVNITTTDTDISAHIQALLQALVALVVKLDIA
ncbi:spore coat protein [Lysinibacillus endophyticus]|uniref:Spore coat protein n=2 Tax=Ureibacillus endophyticus TaxID=1978490 RepID=A0A494Z7B6_9BACL|nr:spore coat protein [Lysinibacillus endophyticus]